MAMIMIFRSGLTLLSLSKFSLFSQQQEKTLKHNATESSYSNHYFQIKLKEISHSHGNGLKKSLNPNILLLSEETSDPTTVIWEFVSSSLRL